MFVVVSMVLTMASTAGYSQLTFTMRTMEKRYSAACIIETKQAAVSFELPGSWPFTVHLGKAQVLALGEQNFSDTTWVGRGNLSSAMLRM